MMCFKVFVAVVIAWCVASSACYALSVKSKTFDQLVLEADEVIQGRVVSIESRFGEGNLSHHIFTYIEFNSLKVINEPDDEAGSSYLLRIVGGRVGNIVQAFPGLPRFQVGQEYVLFVRGNGREPFPLVGVHQGIYQVVADELGGGVIREVGEPTPILRSVAAYRSRQKHVPVVSQEPAVPQQRFEALKADEFIELIRERWQQLRPEKRLLPEMWGDQP